jgi:hypothetical protein
VKSRSITPELRRTASPFVRSAINNEPSGRNAKSIGDFKPRTNAVLESAGALAVALGGPEATSAAAGTRGGRPGDGAGIARVWVGGGALSGSGSEAGTPSGAGASAICTAGGGALGSSLLPQAQRAVAVEARSNPEKRTFIVVLFFLAKTTTAKPAHEGRLRHQLR